jgi:hypothetical protein
MPMSRVFEVDAMCNGLFAAMGVIDRGRLFIRRFPLEQNKDLVNNHAVHAVLE